MKDRNSNTLIGVVRYTKFLSRVADHKISRIGDCCFDDILQVSDRIGTQSRKRKDKPIFSLTLENILMVSLLK